MKVLFAICLLSFTSISQTYVDFPDTSIISTGVPTFMDLDINSDGVLDVRFSAASFGTSFGGQSYTSVEGLDSNQVLNHFSDTIYAQQLEAFATFGPSSDFYSTQGYFLSSSWSNGPISHNGYWSNYTYPLKYCAVKFYANSEWNYAWILTRIENGIVHAKITIYELGYFNDSLYAGEGSPHASIDEIVPVEKTRVKVIDIMGRETEDKANTTVLYIYSDGSVEKVHRME